jgi:hypothetical protein
MFAIELNASRDCTRNTRTESIAMTVTPRAASFSISSGLCRPDKAHHVVPGFSRGISLSSGAFTFRMIGDCQTSALLLFLRQPEYLVIETRQLARAAFNRDGKTQFKQLLHRFRVARGFIG